MIRRLSGEQPDGVLDQRCYHGEAILNTRRAPRQIHDECGATHAGDATRQIAAWCLPATHRSNRLGYARNLAIDHRNSGFGGNVSWRETRAPS